MHNLKYLISGIMVGGAFGAKAGEYFATIADQPNSFAWIESAMVFGCLAGLLTTVSVLAIVKSKSNEQQADHGYFATRGESAVSNA